MKNILILLWVAFFFSSCSNDDLDMEAQFPPKILFSPDTEQLEGKAGDKISLLVIVEGESGFTGLEFRKEVNGKPGTKEVIVENDFETIDTPYEYLFVYEFKVDDVGKTVNLVFTVSHKESTPSGGTVINSNSKSLRIVTQDED